MRYVRIWLFCFALFCAGCLAAGWLNPVIAAADKEKAGSQPAAVKKDAQPGGRGEGFQPECPKDECPTTFGPIVTDTAIPIEPGKFALQPTFGLSFTTHNFSPSWRRISAEGDFKSFGMSLKFTYGLWNNLEVFVVVPLVHNWANSVKEPGPRGERAADFGGLGDINLTFKYRLVEETEVAPTVSAIFSPTFPSGHFRRLNPGRLGTDAIGGGTYAFTTGFNVSKYLKPFILYGNLWYTMQTDHTTVGVDADDNPIRNQNHPRDYVTVNLAAEYPLTKKWVALVELTSTWDAGRLIGHQSNMAPTALLSIL
ncbi:MAG: transporter, partial [Deltaproteobacteria bacterium]|nr:transporter [Deltaproteobacteria bacterium]